jgi:hypothetical protein
LTSREEYSIASSSPGLPLEEGSRVRSIDWVGFSVAMICEHYGLTYRDQPPPWLKFMQYNPRLFSLDCVYRLAIREIPTKFHHALREANLP